MRFCACACALFLLACGSSTPKEESPAAIPETAEPSTETKATPLTRDDMIQICVTLHERAAACPEEFIDTVFELRAKYVPEFAKALADPEAAKEIRAKGLAETKSDGTGPLDKRTARCAEFVDHGPPANERTASISSCFEIDDCTAMMECMTPVLNDRMSQGGYQPPAEE